MKNLSTEQQFELQETIQGLLDNPDISLSTVERNTLMYWSIELKPKRIRKKKSGLDLNTEEGVIEQAYQEHTGNF